MYKALCLEWGECKNKWVTALFSRTLPSKMRQNTSWAEIQALHSGRLWLRLSYHQPALWSETVFFQPKHPSIPPRLSQSKSFDLEGILCYQVVSSTYKGQTNLRAMGLREPKAPERDRDWSNLASRLYSSLQGTQALIYSSPFARAGMVAGILSSRPYIRHKTEAQ